MSETQLGQLIRNIRKRRGWSQETLAMRVGVRQSDISALERGRTLQPGNERLAALAAALDVPYPELVAAATGVAVGEVPGQTIPVLGLIPADTIRFALLSEREDGAVRTVQVTPDRLHGAHGLFGLEISGDCFAARGMFSGDVVILRQPDGDRPKPREIVAVRVNGDQVCLKRWCPTHDGSVELRDGDEHVVYRLSPDDDVQLLGIFVTFEPFAER